MPRPEESAASLLRQIAQERTSTRAFLDKAVPQDLLDEVFSIAQQTPSWCNIQPWRLTLTRGAATESIRAALLETAAKTPPSPDIEFPFTYPTPYSDRRKECGIALYGAMDIVRENKAGRYDAWLRNYAIFDAPHLLVISRDTRLGEYATLDVGVWLGSFLAAAQSMGIATCAMASIAAYPQTLRENLNIPTEETILLGIAIGYADLSNKVNTARTTRQPVSDNLRVVTSTTSTKQD